VKTVGLKIKRRITATIKALALSALLLTSHGFASERPIVNLPAELREENWLGSNGEGSCVHATMVMLLRWQQQEGVASHWRETYGDGEYADSTWNPESNLAIKLDSENVRYAYCIDGDERFLEWALATRRGCGVTVLGGAHMVALVHLDDEWAGILDNNRPDQIIWMRRAKFLAEWKHSNGWAVTPVYTPAPPMPEKRK
jgi:hypothetical protein